TLKNNKEKIAAALAGSVSMGVGQFCTNPGLILLLENETSKNFLESFTTEFKKVAPGTMLNKGIHKACIAGVKELYDNSNVSLVATADQAADNNKHEGQPVAFSIKAENFITDKALHEEVFGPVTLFVLCKDIAQIVEVLGSLHG